MGVNTVYIKGRFKGRYSGPIDKIWGQHTSLFNTSFYNIEVYDTVLIEPYHRRYLTAYPYMEFSELKKVTINFAEHDDDIVFEEDLSNVVINELVVSSIVKDAGKTYGVVGGIIYGTYTFEQPLEVATPTSITKVKEKNNPLRQLFRQDNKNTSAHTSLNPYTVDTYNKKIFGLTVQTWTSRFTAVKQPFWIFLMYSIGFFVFISLLGLNPIFLLAIILGFVFFMGNIIGPLAGRTNIPITANRNMIGTGQRLARFFYPFILLVLLVFSFVLGWKIFGWILLTLWILHIAGYIMPGIYFTRRIWQLLGLIGVLVLGLSLLTYYINNTHKNETHLTDRDNQWPVMKEDSVEGKKVLSYSFNWNDYDGREYKGAFYSLKDHFILSRVNRNTIQQPNGFGIIYEKVWKNDQTLLPSILRMMDSIRVAANLSRIAFADMAVSFVQSIPYVLVHDQSCSEIVQSNPHDAFVQSYHSAGKECLPKIKYGLQAPAEFGYNLKGDCDTRAILLYTILDHFKYDVAMLVSQAYGHCILGVNGLGTGIAKYGAAGKKYVVWETTAKGFRLGQLPGEISNMKNWEIALTSKID